MRIAVLELPASYGAPDRVLDVIDARIAAQPADLFVTPEAALHGYVSPDGDFDISRFAEGLTGPTATRAAAIAAKHRCHLVTSLVLREGDALYNAMTCHGPDGLAFVYRKRHPWIPETWATPGPRVAPVVSIAGVRVTIAVCYDLHFLDDDLQPADVLLFPSAWVERPDSRRVRLQRLAAKRGIAIANANWAPGDVRVWGQGNSCIARPDGSLETVAAPNGRLDLDV
ncbi:MAG: carbon-nitrogen hydrolase family protein [Kofleriaceae bacterium]